MLVYDRYGTILKKKQLNNGGKGHFQHEHTPKALATYNPAREGSTVSDNIILHIEVKTHGITVLETKDVPNGRRRDPAEQPGFRPIYGNTIFGAPDRWPLVTRPTVLILCALPPPWCQCHILEGVGPSCLNLSIQQVSQYSQRRNLKPCVINFNYLQINSWSSKKGSLFSTKIRPEQKRKRHLARLRGEIAPWTGPIREPLYKNTREGQRESRREEYRNRPIIPPSRPDDPIIIGPSPEQREINLRRVLDRIAAADPPPRRYFPTPAERAEFARQISAPATQDFRITRGLFHGPKQHQPNVPVQAAAAEEEGAVGGEEKREEGAVGGEDSEEDETLQLLYESLSKNLMN
ncbi:hypothetical protein OUZ56_033443 [Daphnia magna]|uniref:Uncharacterized protein n=1 Tax=Daphnia magna TaxID=35525 RepID=A0ABQ9ZXU8_9CRUS|nr:hypothetical protein OUZ56_033443 [Daphnia magna]